MVFGCIFKEIAIVFNPQHPSSTEQLLLVQATMITQRIDKCPTLLNKTERRMATLGARTDAVHNRSPAIEEDTELWRSICNAVSDVAELTESTTHAF